MSKIHSFLLWTLRSRVSPLVYLTAFNSLVIGFIFAFFTSANQVTESAFYRDSPVSVRVWGAGLLVASVVLLVGALKNNITTFKYGAMVNFMCWLFACFVYGNHGHWYLLVTFGAYNALSQGYLYLISSIDNLWESRCILDLARVACPREEMFKQLNK